jgi:hypothetical protein
MFGQSQVKSAQVLLKDHRFLDLDVCLRKVLTLAPISKKMCQFNAQSTIHLNKEKQLRHLFWELESKEKKLSEIKPHLVFIHFGSNF